MARKRKPDGGEGARLIPALTPEEWVHTVKTMGLSPQRARVVALALCGKPDKQIAADMGLSASTVRKHLRAAYAHTATGNRLGLALHIWAVVRQLHGEAARRYQD